MSVANYRKFLSDKNPERFNEDLLNTKKNDDLMLYVDCICQALTVIPGIEYLGSKYIVNKKLYTKTDAVKEIDIAPSYLDTINIKFKLLAEGEEEIISKDILFPRLMNGQYFIINGNRFVPIFQVVDAGTYRNKNSLTLKTLLMPIKIVNSVESFEDMNGNSYTGNVYKLDVFKNKLNIFVYYFAKFGMSESLEFLDMKCEFNEKESDEDDVINVKINNNLYLSFKEDYLVDQSHIDLACTLVDMLGKRSRIEDQVFWIKKLGTNFTKNTSQQYEKAIGILLSLERILDGVTRTILRTEEENKRDIYCIIKWMMNNYRLLSKQDTLNLDNKRVRLYEYILNPLLIRFSRSTYRLLNTRKITVHNLKSIFSNIHRGTLVKEIVKHELVRYKNSVNPYDLFTVFLKTTNSGKLCAAV